MENVKVTPQLVETNETGDGIEQGETFEVEFLFEDLVTSPDNNPNGVVLSGYIDVRFDPTSILLAEDGITYGDGYTTNQTGENRLSNAGEQLGIVSEVGAATTNVDLPASQVVFTLTFEAQTDLTLNNVTIDSEKPENPTNKITIASSDDDQTRNTEYGQETIGPAVNIIESEGSTEVSEDGETDSYELVLNSQPTADVTIEISNIGQVSVEPTSLTFTPENWDTPQEVTVTADDDDFAEGDHTTDIRHSVADGSADEYVGVGINNVDANITDNDGGAPEFEGAPFTFDLDPNQADQFSETIAASDPNGDSLNFSITEGNDPDGNDTDAFTVDNDGIITVDDAAELDGQDVFDLTVEASDGELTSSANVEINVGEPPTGGALDIDGNGNVTVTDGRLAFNFLSVAGNPFINPEPLVEGIVQGALDLDAAGATRTTGEDIVDFIDGLT